METVYVDILIATNFITDYFLLMLTAHFSAIRIKRVRMVLGALFASLTSLMIFLPELNAVFQIILKLVASLLIVIVTFGFKSRRRFVKATLIFYLSSAAIAGGALCLWSVFRPKGLVIHNGAVFYNISPILLVLSITAVYFITLGITKIIESRKATGGEWDVTLEFDSNTVNVTAITDSGNMLRDILSGTPVIVCEYNSVCNLFSPELKRVFLHKNFEYGFYSDIVKSGYNDRFRVVPYNTLGNSGLMAALVLDRAVLHKHGKDKVVENVVMAVTHNKIAGGEFDVLLSPELAAV